MEQPKEMSEIMEDNLQGRITETKICLRRISIADFFELILPSLERFVGWIQKAVDWLSGLDEGNKKEL